MRKTILTLTFAVSGMLSFGQLIQTNKCEPLKLSNNDLLLQEKATSYNNKAFGDIIWSEDFTGGLPTNWTVVDNTTNNYTWVVNNSPLDNIANGGFTNVPVIPSVSGGNHMLLFGDNYNLGGGMQTLDSYFQTDAIALSGQPAVVVQFYSHFRYCCSNSTELNLMVSTDPTFPLTAATRSYDVKGNLGVSEHGVPELKAINITNLVGGLTGNIYLRFHWKGSSHYYWMVDDVQVLEPGSNDLLGNEPFFAFGSNLIRYSRIPFNQISPANFIMRKVENIGGYAQTNSILTADINSGSFIATSAPTTINPGDVDSLFTATQYTAPSVVGVNHTVKLVVSSDSTDVTPINNEFEFAPFKITQDIFAHDFFDPTPSTSGGIINGNAEFEVGNYFDIVTTDNLHAIDVVVGAGTPVSTNIQGVLYEYTSTGFNQVAVTPFYNTTALDINNTVSLAFTTPPTVSAGSTYFVAVHTLSEFYYGVSGTSPNHKSISGPTSLRYYPTMLAPNANMNYYNIETPMVRMNFGQVITGINKLGVINSSTIFPNPANNTINVALNTKTVEKVVLSLKNMLGQTVFTKELVINGLTNETINVKSFNRGVYFISIDYGTEVANTKIILK